MKKVILLAFLALFGTTAFSQNSINLKLNHIFKGEPLVFNQNMSDTSEIKVKLSRVRYYLSSIKITHDGNQVTPLTDVYILGEGNVSNYTIEGNYAINSVEKIEFDLGVDYAANHGNTSNFSTSHPLGPKTPAMDWGWPSGYFFFVLHGAADNNGDGNPNQGFQLESFGDVLLRTINPIEFVEPVAVDGTQLEISLFVNVDRWLKGMLPNIGYNHGAYDANVSAADNTISQNVFTAEPPTTINLKEQFNEVSFVTTDYTMPYAPVLFYKFPKSNYSLSIIDVNGKKVASEDNIGFEGNYFVKSELQTGIYFAIFTSEVGHQKTHQFIVNR
jgi:hypothetical protein